jgi:hypothetical protein
MSARAPDARGGGRAGAAGARVRRNWRTLTADQRLAVGAALALLLSMFLPWYEVTTVVQGQDRVVSDTRAAFEVYSFVEAAVFVVAGGVLALMWLRGERRAFHLPGGDGTVVMAGGLWVMFLVFFRQIDKPDVTGGVGTSVGVAWGIFVAFLLGALLAYAGYRIRAAHTPEPPRDRVPPSERPTAVAQRPPAPPPGEAPTAVAPRPGGGEQLSFDEHDDDRR